MCEFDAVQTCVIMYMYKNEISEAVEKVFTKWHKTFKKEQILFRDGGSGRRSNVSTSLNSREAITCENPACLSFRDES